MNFTRNTEYIYSLKILIYQNLWILNFVSSLQIDLVIKFKLIILN